MSNPSTPPVAAGLQALAPRYDGFLLDQWGCIHDGIKPYPQALDALRRLREAGKRTVVLSNAPRRSDAVTASMARLGVPPDLYDAMLSAGEAAWQALALRDDAFHAGLGRRCLHVGPERDNGMLEGNGLIRADGVADADFVLVTGPPDDLLGIEVHEGLLQACRARHLKLLCSNPDLTVMRGDQVLLCAGALAQRYAELGGEVHQYGKPYPEIYARALRLLGVTDRSRVLAVGDSLRTDVAGALAAGLDVAYIPGGIQGKELGGLRMGAVPPPEQMHKLIAEFGATPTWILPELKW